MILEAEEKKSELENQLSLPEVYSNGETAKSVQAQISKIASELEELNAQWLCTAEKLEAFS